MKALTGDSVLYVTSELKPSNEITGTYCKPVRKDCQSTDLGKDAKKIVCFESPNILKRKMFRPNEIVWRSSHPTKLSLWSKSDSAIPKIKHISTWQHGDVFYGWEVYVNWEEFERVKYREIFFVNLYLALLLRTVKKLQISIGREIVGRTV